jgi:hypothetical protein
VTITGSGFEAGGKPDVAGIQVGTWRLPDNRFKVLSNTSIDATFPNARVTRPANAPAPQDGAGPADVFVTVKDGQSSSVSRPTILQYVDESKKGPIPAVTGVGINGGFENHPKLVRIYGSGFAGATRVTFGGVRAASFTVKTPYEIFATPAKYSKAVSCAKSVRGMTPTADICQVQVRVSNAHGTSVTGRILPPFEGADPPLGPMAVAAPPPGCRCELEAGPAEYDYYPAPTITSVSTSAADPGGRRATRSHQHRPGDSAAIVLHRGWPVNVGPGDLCRRASCHQRADLQRWPSRCG